MPSLLQTYNIFANMTILKDAGIKAPTLADPWTWAEFRAIAKKLTNSSRFGVCWGLRSPVAAIQTMSLNYGGQFFYLENGKWTFKFGPNDQNVIKQMHDMIHVDKSVDPAATGLSGSAALPGFFGGKCAMTVAGNFTAQAMIPQSPQGFNWAMFPLLKGQTQQQVANPQTYSISQQSTNKQAAMFFLAYLVNKQNLAKLAARRLADPVQPGGGRSWRGSRPSGSAAGGSRPRPWSTSARGTGSRWPRTPAGRPRSPSPRSSSTCGARSVCRIWTSSSSDGWTRVRG